MVYLPALNNGFVWDDTYFITDLPYLRDPALWWQHIREPLFVSQNYFRPLPLLTFVLEAQFVPLNAFVFHLSNLLLHALNTTLVVLLANTLVAKESRANSWRPVVAGLLFGLHPVLIETVSWISDRFDLMMATFLLLALLSDVTIQSRRIRATTVGTLFLLALLCKETAIVFCALLPLWQLSRRANDSTPWHDSTPWRARAENLLREEWPSVIALGLAALIYFTLRYQSLGVLYRTDTMIVPGSLLQHWLLTAKTLAWYFVLLVCPFGQIGPVHPGDTPILIADPYAWLGVAAVTVVALFLITLLRRTPRGGLLASMAMVALVPVANLVPLTIADNIVHDRYLLLPLVFVTLTMASLPDARQRLTTKFALASWCALALVSIVLTVPRWENNLTLWGWAYALEPSSRIARGNYVAALANENHNQEVIALCGDILREKPDNAVAMHDMALALMRTGRYAESRRYSLMSIQYLDRFDAKGKLDLSEAWNLLGYLDMQDRNWDAAEKSLNEAVRLTPYLTRPHFNLAMVHYERREINAADQELAFALRYDSPELAVIHRAQGERKKNEVLKRARSTTGA